MELLCCGETCLLVKLVDYCRSLLAVEWREALRRGDREHAYGHILWTVAENATQVFHKVLHSHAAFNILN